MHMPANECYVEVGTLEGRTLEAAAHGNDGKSLYGIDPCDKYGIVPDPFTPNIMFIKGKWEDVFSNMDFPLPMGCVFYDADHSADATESFMNRVEGFLAQEAVLVLDDWDRESVRIGAFRAGHHWTLLRECPEYTGNDGSEAQHHFGYAHGVGIWGYKR